ncbi:uncharacterized protein LOC134726676 [Mytilus trossulus]|uniref:uncharacterized protein LOC134726676 n=1 Tax=Mytilus trossulus TaxID=6551 RepID=UPI003004337E
MSEQEILNVFECSNEFDLLSDSETSNSENSTEEPCGSRDVHVYDWDSSDDDMPNLHIPKRQKKKAQKLSSEEENQDTDCSESDNDLRLDVEVEEGNQGSVEEEGDWDSVEEEGDQGSVEEDDEGDQGAPNDNEEHNKESDSEGWQPRIF